MTISTRPGHRTTIARLTGDVSAAETVAFVDHARAHGFTVHVIAVRTEPDATTSSSTARGGSAQTRTTTTQTAPRAREESTAR